MDSNSKINATRVERLLSTNMASSNAQSWLVEIKNHFQEQQDEEDEDEEGKEKEEIFPENGSKRMGMVYMVPQHMRAAQPEAFGPETVCIGPYHAWQSDFHQTERWKIHAVQDFMTHRGLRRADFEKLVVEPLDGMVRTLRGSFDRYLRCGNLELVWLMAIDGIFLLQTLDSLSRDDQPSASKQALLRDMVKLENQLPLGLLQYLNRQGYPHHHKVDTDADAEHQADAKLAEILTWACKQLSPFVNGIRPTRAADLAHGGHLLNVLYNDIVPVHRHQSHFPHSSFGTASNISPSLQMSEEDQKQVTQVFCNHLPALVGSLAKAPILRTITPALELAMKGICAVKDLAKSSSSKKKKQQQQDQDDENDEETLVAPAAQELAIPSVSELRAAGVRLCSSKGGLSSIHFRAGPGGRATLQLPVVRMDGMSDVVIRNLVALEACAAPAGFMPLTRYIDFFNGIIDTADDVRLLRECGVIQQRKQNDLQVANLWNGIGACARLPPALILDKLIDEVNAFYARRWRVRLLSLVDTYIFAGWRFLTLAAAVFLLLLTLFNTFCDAYNCSRWFNTASLVPGKDAAD